MNFVLYFDEQVDARKADGLTHTEAVAKVHADLRNDYPVDFGIIDRVTYNDKTDRYVVKGGYGNPANTVRISADVATFLLTHAKPGATYGPVPTIRARMTEGVMDAVAVVFLYREVQR